MPYYDAHCHLQDSRLNGVRESAMIEYEQLGVERVVVNGTRESDWESVAELARRHAIVKPSFGLHPWFVDEASDDWKASLENYWKAFPEGGVGEIGLDRWIEGFNIERQMEAFEWQLEHATRLNRPVSIHCLRAWGLLLDTLRSSTLPPRGFLLHSYGGPMEMIDQFVDLGAYFSISVYFALDRKQKQREVFRRVPLDRLLIETDAPDMLGPDRFVTADSNELASGVNHPANIVGVYKFTAELRGMNVEELSCCVSENWIRFFEA